MSTGARGDSIKTRVWKVLEAHGYAYLEAGDIVEWLAEAGLLAQSAPSRSGPSAWRESEEVKAARERAVRRLCPDCGHAVICHGENHDDGCNEPNCECGLNARDCDSQVDDEANIDALCDAVARASSSEKGHG